MGAGDSGFPLPWAPAPHAAWLLVAANGRQVANFVAWSDTSGSLLVAEQHCREVAALVNSGTANAPALAQQMVYEHDSIDANMNDLRVMQRLVVMWADSAFPDRAPASALLKLYEEIGELIRAPANAEEYADILIMLVDLAHMHGVTDMGAAVRAKMKTNSRRKWTPTAIGTMQHTEE
jgi:NTP pyrophosphatase (non-canonical NTP hydrolase)